MPSTQPDFGPSFRGRALGFFRSMLFIVWASGGCSNSQSELNLVSQAGEACQDCGTCSSALENCHCDTCTPRAYDPQKKELLACVQGQWAVILECPGGVSAVCSSKGYDPETHCLDTNGNELH
jgi:hypothetical protein